MSLADLPEDCFGKLLKYLDVESRYNFGETCSVNKYYNDKFKNNNYGCLIINYCSEDLYRGLIPFQFLIISKQQMLDTIFILKCEDEHKINLNNIYYLDNDHEKYLHLKKCVKHLKKMEDELLDSAIYITNNLQALYIISRIYGNNYGSYDFVTSNDLGYRLANLSEMAWLPKINCCQSLKLEQLKKYKQENKKLLITGRGRIKSDGRNGRNRVINIIYNYYGKLHDLNIQNYNSALTNNKTVEIKLNKYYWSTKTFNVSKIKFYDLTANLDIKPNKTAKFLINEMSSIDLLHAVSKY